MTHNVNTHTPLVTIEQLGGEFFLGDDRKVLDFAFEVCDFIITPTPVQLEIAAHAAANANHPNGQDVLIEIATEDLGDYNPTKLNNIARDIADLAWVEPEYRDAEQIALDDEIARLGEVAKASKQAARTLKKLPKIDRWLAEVELKTGVVL
jgi:hypothetical protein